MTVLFEKILGWEKYILCSCWMLWIRYSHFIANFYDCLIRSELREPLSVLSKDWWIDVYKVGRENSCSVNLSTVNKNQMLKDKKTHRKSYSRPFIH